MYNIWDFNLKDFKKGIATIIMIMSFTKNDKFSAIRVSMGMLHRKIRPVLDSLF